MSPATTRRSRLARALGLLAATLALTALPAGTASAAPGPLSLNTSSYDFGTVELNRGGQSASFDVQNDGPDWVPVHISFSGDDASAFWTAWNCGGNVGPGLSCGIGVYFNPQQPRDYHATLHVSDGSGGEVTAALTGTGGLREVTATPNPVDFGTVTVGESSTRSVTMQNTGNVYFQSMVALPVGGHVGAFRVIEDGCSMSILAPSATCKMKLRFSPYEADNAEAMLAIVGEGEPALVVLRGVGVAAAATPAAPATAGSGGGPAASAAPSTGPAASSTGGAGDRPDAGERAERNAKRRGKRPARVAFNWRRGLPAPYRRNRVDLGIARCQGAPTCRVSVQTWFVTRGSAADSSSRTRTTRVRRSTWWVGNGSRVALWAPRGLRVSPLRAIVTLRTKAAGRPDGVQRLNVRLLEGVRRGGAIVATPSGGR
jgi:hypothetical protein